MANGSPEELVALVERTFGDPEEMIAALEAGLAAEERLDDCPNTFSDDKPADSGKANFATHRNTYHALVRFDIADTVRNRVGRDESERT